jgi:lysylphosphatidylglycerol synthetase-like protein (DUF2156 family)
MSNDSKTSLTIGICCLLSVAGTVEPVVLKWISIGIAATLAILLILCRLRFSKDQLTGSNSYPDEVNKFLDDWKDSAVPKYTLAPPLHRALWRAGFSLRPPLLESMAKNFAIFSVFSAVFLAVFVVLWFSFRTASHPMDWLYAGVISGLTGGTLFGLAMAIWYRRQAVDLRLER